MVIMTTTQTMENNTKNNQNPYISNIIKTKKLPNCLLLHGPNQNKVMDIVYNIAQSLHHLETFPMINPDSHLQELAVDLILINEPNTTIKIDIIKQLQNRIKYGPSSRDQCIVIIKNSQKLTITTSNALLKTIEDPPKNVVFIFTTTNQFQLMNTIISRCEQCYISSTQNEIISFLKSNAQKFNTDIDIVSIKDLLKKPTFDQIQFIQSLPYNSSNIEQLLILWKIELIESIDQLNKTEKKFLEKTIEIIATIKYNLNLKLQLTALLLELKED